MPIEYKTGKRFHYAATVQLAAQALCLEEMLDTAIPVGVIYTVGSNTRHPITIDADLRTAVAAAAKAVRKQATDQLPEPVADERCRRCSLNDRCLPSLVADPQRVSKLAAATKEL
jgi:CRISPR-associated exonuclease Cas4